MYEVLDLGVASWHEGKPSVHRIRRECPGTEELNPGRVVECEMTLQSSRGSWGPVSLDLKFDVARTMVSSRVSQQVLMCEPLAAHTWSQGGHLDEALPHRRPADLQLEEDDGSCARLPVAAVRVRGAVGGTDREVGCRVLRHHQPFEAVGGGEEAARIRL